MDDGVERDPNPNMIVAVRVRPDNDKEKHNPKSRTVVRVLDERVVIFDPADTSTAHCKGVPDHFRRSRDQRYIFDRVFDDFSSQDEVYDNTAKHLIEGVLNGFNATVFAYGATGSGKTHTMIGNAKMPGVMPLALQDLFSRIDERQDDKAFTVSVSYLEIFNEMIRDLLVEGSASLDLRASANDTAVVAGLTQHKVECADEIMNLLMCGNTRRAVSPTDANEVSSRSHAVLQVLVHQKDRTADVRAAVKMGKLALIDLAGSERACVSKNCGDRLKEGANINKSLLALGNCINALGEGAKRGGKVHVPYRNSKLTRLLKDSLGGNCRTVMIATVSPSSLSYEDSLNTLKYANRAKNIRMQVKRNVVNVNYHVAEYKQIVNSLRSQVLALKTKIQHLEKEKQEYLGTSGHTRGRPNANVKNSASEEREQLALQSIIAKIRANLEERARFNQNMRELDERNKLDVMAFDKKQASVLAWESNPNRGLSGVYTPPQIAKMREEMRTIKHNSNERSLHRQNVQRKLETNIAAHHQLQAEMEKVIKSAHRRKLLEQEEKIHILLMEKTDIKGEKELLKREVDLQAGRIAQMEALLKQQSLLLKGQGLLSEQLSREYTSTTGDILFTPRRSPGSAISRRLQEETTDLFLQASRPNEVTPAYASDDDVQNVVRGMSRVQLSQEAMGSSGSSHGSNSLLDDPSTRVEEPYSNPIQEKPVFSLPSASATTTSSQPSRSPFRPSPGRHRPRRLRSILKKPNIDSTAPVKQDKKVVFSGVPDSNSPLTLDDSGPPTLKATRIPRTPTRVKVGPEPEASPGRIFNVDLPLEETEVPKRRKRPTLPTPSVPTLAVQSLAATGTARARRPKHSVERLSRVMQPTQASLQRSNKRKSQQVDSINGAAPALATEPRRLSREKKPDSSTKENTNNNNNNYTVPSTPKLDAPPPVKKSKTTVTAKAMRIPVQQANGEGAK